MALPVSKPAPEFAFLRPLGDLFVMLQPGPQMWLFINWVKVVREVRINSDLWVLIMLKGNDDLNGSLLSDYPQLNAIPILFYLYTISTILPNVNIWNLIAGERTFSTNFQRKVQIRMCWKTSWKHFVKKYSMLCFPILPNYQFWIFPAKCNLHIFNNGHFYPIPRDIKNTLLNTRLC